MTLVDQSHPDARAVTVWTLQMTSPQSVICGRMPPVDVQWKLVTDAKAELSADLYTRVGRPWGWLDRIDWTSRDWEAWTNRDTHHLYLGLVEGEICGYVELDQVGKDVELAFFGLLGGFIGQGLGGWLLSSGLLAAWQLPGVERVWVHTCDLDSPTALGNYQARGLVIAQTTVEWRLPLLPEG